MPRVARIIVPGLAHHVTQRGNNRQDVFFVDDDRRVYLSLLKGQSDKYGLDVLGYCLMTNHVHLVAIPWDEHTLAKAVGRTHYLYTLYLNRLHGRCGHVWQNRFFSCALDDRHLLAAMRYVERNPVRAKLVRVPWRYPWSSAGAHCGEAQDDTGLLGIEQWKKQCGGIDWPEQLRRAEGEEELGSIRLSTHRGRPLATDSFLAKLESRLGRRLRPLPVGRPRKKREGDK